MRRRPPVRRNGPGVLGTVARTAVIAGTATATAKGVSGAMDSAAQRQQQEQMAKQTAEAERLQGQADLEQLKTQMEAMQAQQVQAATGPAANTDFMAQLQQLAQLKQSGMLTEEEFQLAKTKLLSS
jgi:Short C-terminal domain